MTMRLLSALLLLLASEYAYADTIAIATTRTGLNDTAVWPGTCVQSLPSVSSTSSNGVTVTATDAMGGIDTDTQKPPGCTYDGWAGNFAPGDNLLYTGFAFSTGQGPMTLIFSTPVSGVGTQLQAQIGGPFTARIQIYDGSTLLGTFSETGISNQNADNSAIFLGAIDSTAPDITSTVFSLTSSVGNFEDFAINDVSLRDPVATVPESSTFLLLGLGLLGMVTARGKFAHRSHKSRNPLTGKVDTSPVGG